MAIQYIYPPTGEATVKEPWRWVASYKDGTKLEQFEVTANNGPIFHRSAEIDSSKLDELMLIHDTHAPITIKFPEGATPVHFYRHRTVHEIINQGTDNELSREWHFKIWCIGFRLAGKKRDRYWLVFVDENGHSVYTDDKELFSNKLMPAELVKGQ